MLGGGASQPYTFNGIHKEWWVWEFEQRQSLGPRMWAFLFHTQKWYSKKNSTGSTLKCWVPPLFLMDKTHPLQTNHLGVNEATCWNHAVPLLLHPEIAGKIYGKVGHRRTWRCWVIVLNQKESTCWLNWPEFKHPLTACISTIWTSKNTSLQQKISMSLHVLRQTKLYIPICWRQFLTPQQPQQSGNDPLLS